MNTREAYDAIRAAMGADPRTEIVDGFYDGEVFGNFWLTYVKDGERLSLVNDRGQLLLHDGPELDQFKELLLDDLHSADRKTLLDAIG